MMHPDGYIEIRDRSKEIVISGGESISSIEIEKVQYEHPAVSVAAAVAAPDEKWGESPCALVELAPGADATETNCSSIAANAWPDSNARNEWSSVSCLRHPPGKFARTSCAIRRAWYPE